MPSQIPQTIQQIEHALHEIGYRPKFIQRNYEYVDLFSYPPKTRSIDLGVFGREPFDYRSACFGFSAPKNGKSSEAIVEDARFLGAPQVFIVREENTERWVLTDNGKKFKDRFQTRNIHNVISENKEDWSPQSVLRAKCGFESSGMRQLDFIDFGFLPALEQEANKKLDELIKRILSTTEKSSKKFNAKEVFHIVFCFLAAKLLKDRQIKTDPPIDFSFPEKTLEAISHYYGETFLNPNHLCLQVISEEFKSCFSFRNLSVDSLTYVYENTFVSEQKRKELGIHSTPSYIANYILSKMPIEDIPRNRWKVLDPTCGHGIFLIAAMRRMRELLPEEWGGQRRHQFFANAICGIEIEPFAVEVAKLCLRLADFPEQDGWKIINENTFSTSILQENISNTTILVGNPPFELLEGVHPDTPKPAELLNRILPNLPQGALVGLVLPRSFLDGLDYRNQRNTFLSLFEILSLTNLPDQMLKPQ
ncbi:MAG: DNA methyltransferase [Candidatus Anammoxibacter sp.]